MDTGPHLLLLHHSSLSMPQHGCLQESDPPLEVLELPYVNVDVVQDQGSVTNQKLIFRLYHRCIFLRVRIFKLDVFHCYVVVYSGSHQCCGVEDETYLWKYHLESENVIFIVIQLLEHRWHPVSY